MSTSIFVIDIFNKSNVKPSASNTGQSGNTLEGESQSINQSTNLADQMTNSALRYRAQAPLVDSLMNELGIKGGDINGFTSSLSDQK